MALIIHTPPVFRTIPEGDPTTFLAGPIQGAPDWQATAIKVIAQESQPDMRLHIANSRRTIVDPARFNKNEQIDWEKAHLRTARDCGALIFWLAAETDDAPAPNKPGRAYAQTTRQEFGRAVGWYDYNPNVVISLGMEEGYQGNNDYYRHTAYEIGLPIHTTLEETCINALKQIESVKYGAV